MTSKTSASGTHPFRPPGSSPSAIPFVRPSTPPPSTLELSGLVNAPPSSQRNKPYSKRSSRSRQNPASPSSSYDSRNQISSNRPPSTTTRPSHSGSNTLPSTQQSDLDFGGTVPPSQSSPTMPSKHYSNLLNGGQHKEHTLGGPSGQRATQIPGPSQFSPQQSPGSIDVTMDSSQHTMGKSAKYKRRKNKRSKPSQGPPPKKDPPMDFKRQKPSKRKRHHKDNMRSWRDDADTDRGRSQSGLRAPSRARSKSRSRRSSSKRRRRSSTSDSEDDSDGSQSESSSESETDSDSDSDSSGNSLEEQQNAKRPRKRARTDASLSSSAETVVTFWLKSADVSFERILDSSLTLASAKEQVRSKFGVSGSSAIRLMCQSSLGGQIMLDDEDDLKAFKLRASRSQAESNLISVNVDQPPAVAQPSNLPPGPSSLDTSPTNPWQSQATDRPTAPVNVLSDDRGSEAAITGSQPAASTSAVSSKQTPVQRPEDSPSKTAEQTADVSKEHSATAVPTGAHETAESQSSPTRRTGSTTESEAYVPPSVLAHRRRAAEQSHQSAPRQSESAEEAKTSAKDSDAITPSQAVADVAQQVGVAKEPLPAQPVTETPWVLRQISKGSPCGICGAKPCHDAYLCPTLNQGGLEFAQRRVHELLEMKHSKKDNEKQALRDLKSWVSVIKKGGQVGEKALPSGEITVGDVRQTSVQPGKDAEASQPSAPAGRRGRKRKQQEDEQEQDAVVKDTEARSDLAQSSNASRKGGTDKSSPAKQPAKEPIKKSQAAEDVTVKTPTAETPKKRPGRPAKNAVDASPVVKRKPGRPAKATTVQTSAAQTAPAPSADNAETADSANTEIEPVDEVPPPKAKRARRKKAEIAAEREPQAKAQQTVVENAPAAGTDAQAEEAQQTPKPRAKRGRPSKADVTLREQQRKQDNDTDNTRDESSGAEPADGPAQLESDAEAQGATDAEVEAETLAQTTDSQSAAVVNSSNVTVEDAGVQPNAEVSDQVGKDTKDVDPPATPATNTSKKRTQTRKQNEASASAKAQADGNFTESAQEMQAMEARWTKVRKDCEAAQKKVAEFMGRQAGGETFSGTVQGSFTRGKNALIRYASELEEVESEMSDFSSAHDVRRPPQAPELGAALALRTTLMKQKNEKASAKKTHTEVAKDADTTKKPSANDRVDDDAKDADGPAEQDGAKDAGQAAESPSKGVDQRSEGVSDSGAGQDQSTKAPRASAIPGLRPGESDSEGDVETSPLLESAGEPLNSKGVGSKEATATEENIPSQPLPPPIDNASHGDEAREGTQEQGHDPEASTTAVNASSEATHVSPKHASNPESAHDGDDASSSDTSDDSDEEESSSDSDSDGDGEENSDGEQDTESKADAERAVADTTVTNGADDEDEEEDEIVDSQTAQSDRDHDKEEDKIASDAESSSSPSRHSSASSRTQSASPIRDAEESDVDATKDTEVDPISSFSARAKQTQANGSQANQGDVNVKAGATPTKGGPTGDGEASKTSSSGGGGGGGFFSPFNFFQGGRGKGNPFASSSQQSSSQVSSPSQPSPSRATGLPPASSQGAKRSRLGMPRLSELDASMLRRRNHSANGAGSGASTPNSITGSATGGMLSPAGGFGGANPNNNGFFASMSQQQQQPNGTASTADPDDEEPDAGVDGDSEGSSSSSDDDSDSDSDSSDSDAPMTAKSKQNASEKKDKKKAAATPSSQRSILPASKRAGTVANGGSSQDALKKKRKGRSLADLF